MKTKLILLFLFVFNVCAGQLIDPKKTTKNKVQNRTNSSIDRSIDKGLDKLEDSIGSIFKKKDKSKDTAESKDKNSTNTKSTQTNEEQENAPSNNSSNEASTINQTKSLKSYSNFDFVQGEKIIGVEDFMQDNIGDFPDKWNTNSSGEVVRIDGTEGNWLKLAKKGVYYPEFINELPENATIEFDMAVSDDYSEMMSGLRFYLVDKKVRNTMFDLHFDKSAQVGVNIHPFGNTGNGYVEIWVYDNSGNKIVENKTGDINWKPSEVNRISIWKQKNRYRLYINEAKVWDLPKAIDGNMEYAPLFATNAWHGDLFISQLRVAVGAPDTRSKLITEGKLVTRGITFDVNSDKIKPESYGTLKEIAEVLKSNPDIQVKIVGHTDSDGDEASNLQLSKRRSESVKKTLNAEFGIQNDRIQTDGKGESEPAEPNTTAQGKANNRRVEFIKL